MQQCSERLFDIFPCLTTRQPVGLFKRHFIHRCLLLVELDPSELQKGIQVSLNDRLRFGLNSSERWLVSMYLIFSISLLCRAFAVFNES